MLQPLLHSLCSIGYLQLKFRATWPQVQYCPFLYIAAKYGAISNLSSVAVEICISMKPLFELDFQAEYINRTKGKQLAMKNRELPERIRNLIETVKKSWEMATEGIEKSVSFILSLPYSL